MTDKLLEDELETVSKLLDKELSRYKKVVYDMKGESRFRTICQVLRDIYHGTEDEKIKDFATEATIMAKKMTLSMVENKIYKQYKKGFKPHKEAKRK